MRLEMGEFPTSLPQLYPYNDQWTIMTNEFIDFNDFGEKIPLITSGLAMPFSILPPISLSKGASLDQRFILFANLLAIVMLIVGFPVVWIPFLARLVVTCSCRSFEFLRHPE